MTCRRLWFAWLVVPCSLLGICPAQPARAYITNPVPTLGRLTESTYITLVRVEKVGKDTGIILYRKVHDIKGTYPRERIKHVFDLKNTPQHQGSGDVPVRPDETDWKYAVQWAEPGKTAVMFTLKYDPFGDFGHTYIDGCWYATMCPKRDWEFWYSIYSTPELLSRWHCGTPAQLVAAVEMILAGKEAAVPVLAQGTKADVRAGLAKIQGLKVGAKIVDYDPKRDQATGVLDKAAVPSLVKSLQDPSREIRARAAMQLGLIGTPGDGAFAALLRMLRDRDAELRIAALLALEQIGLEGKEAVPALITALKDRDPTLRSGAARELGKLGPQARPAVPALTTVLAMVDGTERIAVAESMVHIDHANKDGGAFLAGVLLDLKTTSRETRLRAAESMAVCGTPGVAVLVQATKDPDEFVRARAADLLGRMGPVARSAVPVLAKMLSDNDLQVCLRAAEALPKLGPDSKKALPALKAALKDPRLADRKDVLGVIADACEKLQ